MKSEVPILKYVCPKCGGKKYLTKGVVIQHSQFSQVFSIPGRKYTAVICDRCKYADFYNLPPKRIGEAFDFSSGRF
jgi:predicted nucleic-acid-binding Zn-ribbon protein